MLFAHGEIEASRQPAATARPTAATTMTMNECVIDGHKNDDGWLMVEEATAANKRHVDE